MMVALSLRRATAPVEGSKRSVVACVWFATMMSRMETSGAASRGVLVELPPSETRRSIEGAWTS